MFLPLVNEKCRLPCQQTQDAASASAAAPEGEPRGTQDGGSHAHCQALSPCSRPDGAP